MYKWIIRYAFLKKDAFGDYRGVVSSFNYVWVLVFLFCDIVAL
jgi:hypothetical protein